MDVRVRREERSVTRQKLFTRDALLCALLVCVCLLIIWPIAEIGINDDWSMILTTQAFVRTHHFVYNGWSAVMLGWQVLWGALFAWMGRADFIGIRLSTIPIALATAVLYHAILRNFGLNRAHALFGTLTLVLSPLFLALSATFMTDIPGLFVMLLCLYLCQRALAARQDRHAALWLAAAGLTNIPLGTVRQATWLGLLIMVPCCAWLLRRRRNIVPLTIVLWVAGVICIKLLTAWFFRHPYSIPLTLLPKSIDAKTLWRLLRSSSQVVTTSLLLILPVLVAGVAARWPPSKKQVLRTLAAWIVLGALYLAFKHLGKPDLPDSIWSGNIITPYGIMQGPDLFGVPFRVEPSRLMALFIVLLLSTIGFFKAICRPRTAQIGGPELPELSWRTVNVLLLPFLAFYLLLLFPLALISMFDRYLLPIVAILLVFTLRWHQERVSRDIPMISMVTLGVIVILGVAGTHDLFSLARAEVRLTNDLQKAGVPRTQIRAGFDFDTVTEVYTAGYVNDPHLVNPPGAFHPHLRDETGPCGDPFLLYLPDLHPKYVVTAGLSPCTVPTDIASQTFRTWLPPTHRQLFVVERERQSY